MSNFIFEVDLPADQRTLSEKLIERCDDPSETVSEFVRVFGVSVSFQSVTSTLHELYEL